MLYFKRGPFRFLASREYADWDGGGMLCVAPIGYRVVLDIGLLRFQLHWNYTERQLKALAKTQPEEWSNCSYR